MTGTTPAAAAPRAAFGPADRSAVSHTTARTWLDQAMDLAIAVGLVVLILVGFATSYRTLRDLAATSGGYPPWLAPAVPLSFDLGIVVLSLKITRAAREGRSAPVLRLLVAALSLLTVAANAAAADELAAQLLHAVPPAMFVICFETVIISARRHALERMGRRPQPLPRLRTAQWLLAPAATWREWRNLVLGQPADSATAERVRSAASPAPAVAPAPRKRTPPAQPQRADRLQIAARHLAERPTATAAQLAAALAAEGHPVSIRTAQRIRNDAAAQLAKFG